MEKEIDWVKLMQDVLEGTGKHKGHTVRQIGRCVYCSCGDRVQVNGKLDIPPERQTEAEKFKFRTFGVELNDGFVCYKTDSEELANEVAKKHKNSKVIPLS